jgi:hypothetical protein
MGFPRLFGTQTLSFSWLCSFRAPIFLAFLGCLCNSLFLHPPGSLPLPTAPVILSRPLLWTYIQLLLAQKKSPLRAKQRYHFLYSYWFSLSSPFRKWSLSHWLSQFFSSLAYIRPDFPYVVHSASCLLLAWLIQQSESQHIPVKYHTSSELRSITNHVAVLFLLIRLTWTKMARKLNATIIGEPRSYQLTNSVELGKLIIARPFKQLYAFYGICISYIWKKN